MTDAGDSTSRRTTAVCCIHTIPGKDADLDEPAVLVGQILNPLPGSQFVSLVLLVDGLLAATGKDLLLALPQFAQGKHVPLFVFFDRVIHGLQWLQGDADEAANSACTTDPTPKGKASMPQSL
jgi:hypothetical protein